nr:hypothetical protein BaRGS_028118 [Batillaria attramentaria]
MKNEQTVLKNRLVTVEQGLQREDDVLPLEGVVQQQAATIQTLQADLNAVKNKLSVVETGLQKEVQHKQVAFHVHFTGGWVILQTGQHGTLKFNAVVSNVGGGYNTESGMFTAPFSGTYLFLLGAMPDSSSGELAIMKTGRQTLALTFGEQAGAIQHLRDTAQAAVHLSQGEQVWVEHHYGSTSYREYWATVFTGVLVQAD